MHSVAARLNIGLIAMIANTAFAAETSPRIDPAVVKAGRAIYRHSCASCHGARGEGAAAWEIPDQLGELPAPPHDAKGHTWRHSDAMLYRIVQDGLRDEFNKTDRLTMPAFKGQLSHKETIAVIAYLKTLWTPEQRQFQWEESRRQPFPAAP
jgi:mono/diheme cytochrome c family protein